LTETSIIRCVIFRKKLENNEKRKKERKKARKRVES
jgi:hypothetical protein